MPPAISPQATTHPRLILLCGLPGAGKTPFARRLHERNQRGSGGTISISRANLEEWSSIFQAPDAAEFALFDRAAEIADARTFPI